MTKLKLRKELEQRLTYPFMSEKILIPRKKEIYLGKEFPDSYIKIKRPYPGELTVNTLIQCYNQGFEALFMPDIIDARIESQPDAYFWQNSFSTISIKVTGKTKKGNAVVVYAHVPNYFSNAINLARAIRGGLVDSAAGMPKHEFQRLLELEDNKKVFVVNCDKLKKFHSDKLKKDSMGSGIDIPIKEVLKHPQTIPFIGGRERAERYIECFRNYEEIYNKKEANRISLCYSQEYWINKLLARFLIIGNIGESPEVHLHADTCLNNSLNFLGIRIKEGKKITPQTLEQILELIEDLIPDFARPEFEKRLLNKVL